MKRLALTVALSALLAGCGSTTYVPVATNFGPHKAPQECFYADDAKKDLAWLTMPAGDVTLMSLTASVATTHRTNRGLYRRAISALKVCGNYVRRLNRAKA